MKMRKVLVAAVIAVLILACAELPSIPLPMPSTVVPTLTPPPLGVAPSPLRATSTVIAPTATASASPTVVAQPTPSASAVSFTGGSIVIPPGLASGILSETVPAVDEQSGAPWDVGPAHLRLTLQDYVLQGTFFQGQIMIYPAQEYAAVSPGASNSIQRLQTLLANPGAAMTNDVLPHLPFANADQMIDAQPRIIEFAGGGGVRVVTEYAQYVAPINNHDLFYHFEGLTSDGKSYIVATLPVHASFLAAESDPASQVPSDGVPFPGMGVTDASIFQSYYQAIVSKMNGAPNDTFQPTLGALDALVRSLQVSP